MKRLRRINITFAVLAGVIIISVFSYIGVLVQVKKNLAEQTTQHIKDITAEIGGHMESIMDERFSVLAAYSYYISAVGDMSDDDKILFAKECAEREDMISIEVLEYDGESVPYSTNTIQEETDDKGNKIIAFYLPFTDEDKNYVVKGTCSIESFSESVSIEAFGQTKNTFIVKRDGTVITAEEGINSLDDIFKSQSQYSKLLISSIQSRNTGNITYTEDGNKRYICYANISYNNWYIIAFVSSDVIESKYDEVSVNGIVLSVVLMLVIIILVSYIAYFSKRYVLYKNIVSERREIYSKHTGYVLFDYRVNIKSLEISEGIKDILGYIPELEDGKITFLSEKSREKILDIVDQIKEKEHIENVELEAVTADGTIKNVKVTLTAIKRKNGEVVRIVGSIL